jgi:hypothetical protein
VLFHIYLYTYEEAQTFLRWPIFFLPPRPKNLDKLEKVQV